VFKFYQINYMRARAS